MPSITATTVSATPEALQAIVAKYPELEPILAQLFPGVPLRAEKNVLRSLTKDERTEIDNRLVDIWEAFGLPSHLFKVRRAGTENGKAFYLDEDYVTWSSFRDSRGRLCLKAEWKPGFGVDNCYKRD